MRWRSWVIITPPKRDGPIYASEQLTAYAFSAASRLRSTPYSHSTRKILKDGLQQLTDRDRSVNSCAFGGMGLQGKGEIWSAPRKRKGISPFPCTITVEAWRGWSWVTAGLGVGKRRGTGLRMWKWLRMKISARCRTMATSSGVPRLRVLTPNTRCLKSESRAAGRALLQNEHSDEVKGNTPSRLAIRASRKQSQPLHDVE